MDVRRQIAGIKENDEKVLQFIYKDNFSKVEHFIINNNGSSDDAKDIYQEAFLAVWRNIQADKFSPANETALSGYIYQVARNIFSDHYQATRNRFSDFVNVEEIRDQVEDAAESEQLEERDQLLHKSLAKLSPEQRELLVLTRFERMKYEEVATIMDTSVANIKVRVHRAMAKLRECYFEVERSNSD